MKSTDNDDKLDISSLYNTQKKEENYHHYCGFLFFVIFCFNKQLQQPRRENVLVYFLFLKK